MADTANITTNITDGATISSSVISGASVQSTVVESTSVTANVITGGRGEDGAPGATGATGAAGVGVPTGGTTGQVLAKTSATDYATQWVNQSSGGSGITRTVTVTSGSFTAGSTASTDYVYLIAGSHAVTLPTASGNSDRYTFKNNHSANVTITRAGSDTVEGSTSISIAPGSSVDLISNSSTAWNVI